MDVALHNHSTIKDNQLNEYTWQEIKKHNNHKDCWIVFDNNVYDVTIG